MGKKILIIVACFAAAVLIVVFIPSFLLSSQSLQVSAEKSSLGMFQQNIVSVNAQEQQICRLYADGNYVGVLSDTSVLDAHLKEVYHDQYEEEFPQSACHLGRGVYLTEEESFFTYENVDAKILAYLDQNSLYTLESTAVTFSDQKGDYAEIYVSDAGMFDDALHEYLSFFADEEAIAQMPSGKTLSDINVYGTKDVSASIAQTITKTKKNVSPDEIKTSPQEILQYLEYGDHTEREYYTVQAGDTVAGVGAKNYGLSALQLMNINRSILTSEDQSLTEGTKLCITYFESPIDVVVTRQTLQQEEIAYATVIREDTTLEEDAVQIAQTGMNGSRNALYVEKWVNGVLNSGTLKSSVDTKDPVNEILAVSSGRRLDIGTGSFIYPVSNPRISCSWGCYVGHEGVDFVNAYDRWGSVLAADTGTVIEVSYNAEDGNYIRIDHNNGYITFYGHLRVQPSLQPGDIVQKGQIIGQIGMTGKATGPNVHFTIEHNGKEINACEVSGFPSCEGISE